MSQSVDADLRGRRVAVTGATGFIGSFVCESLVAHGAAVIALAPEAGWRPVVPTLMSTGHAKLRRIDVLTATEAQVADALDGVDDVVHLAYTPPPRGSIPSEHEWSRNVEGTLRLLHALPSSVDRFVFASSVQVYGEPARLPVREDQACAPITPYGEAKLATEQFVLDATGGAPANVVILRLSTVYGPMETVPRAIPNFIRRVLAGRSPTIRGDGSELRDYIHVRDVARGITLASASTSSDVGICNLGTGIGTSTHELARHVVALVGGDEEATHLPGAASASIVCDVTRATDVLGHRSEIGLIEGLRDEIDWFAHRPDLWESTSGR